MEITDGTVGDAAVLRVTGRVDGSVSKTLEERLAAALAAAPRLVVDLSGMSYISSAGLRALLVAAKSAKANNVKLALSGLHPNVREVFDMSGFTALFRIAETDEAAAAAIA